MKVTVYRVNITTDEGKYIVGFATLLTDGTYLIRTIYGYAKALKSEINRFFESYQVTFNNFFK